MTFFGNPGAKAGDDLGKILEQAVWRRRSARARQAEALGYRLEDVEGALLLLRHACAQGLEVEEAAQRTVLDAWQAISAPAESAADEIPAANRETLLAALRRLQEDHPADPLFIEDALAVMTRELPNKNRPGRTMHRPQQESEKRPAEEPPENSGEPTIWVLTPSHLSKLRRSLGVAQDEFLAALASIGKIDQLDAGASSVQISKAEADLLAEHLGMPKDVVENALDTTAALRISGAPQNYESSEDALSSPEEETTHGRTTKS